MPGIEPDQDIAAESPAVSGTSAAEVPLLQATRLDDAGQHDAARRHLRTLAESGDSAALTALGFHLLTKPPVSFPDGIRTMIDAANDGSAEAMYFCGVMSALGAGLPQDWTAALECLHGSAARGWKPAQAQLRLLAGDRAGTDWRALRDALDISALTKPVTTRSLSPSPRIFAIENFLSAEFCDWLIEKARPKIARARTYDAASATGKIDPTRNNSAAEFAFVETDMALTLVRARIVAAAGLSAAGMEHTQILHYAPGEHFAPHFDFLDPAIPALARNIAQAGQRAATFLIYLNDDFDGAETAFPKLDLRYRGAKGDALLFWNVDEAGCPDRSTLHAGLAPARGEKWLLSQWLRVPPVS